MRRQSTTKTQQPENSASFSSSIMSRRRTDNRRSLAASTVETLVPSSEQQTETSPNLSGVAPYSHQNPTSIPVLSNSPYPVQAKLKIGQPNDKYEQEADRMADRVMRMPDPRPSSLIVGSPLDNIAIPNGGSIQRACASCSGEYKTAEDENRPIQPANLCPKCRTQEHGLIQTMPITPFVQTKINADLTPEVTPAIGAGIQSLQGGGQPMAQSERGFFEPRFGADFSGVRVHSDARAASVAQSINARAFTHGQNIVFGAGEYSSGSESGKRLLAHELTHVQQQQGGSQLQRATTSLSNNLELKKPIESDRLDRPLDILPAGITQRVIMRQVAMTEVLDTQSERELTSA